MSQSEKSPELHEARKALHCLYLAADESVARDVSQKVEAAFASLIAGSTDSPSLSETAAIAPEQRLAMMRRVDDAERAERTHDEEWWEIVDALCANVRALLRETRRLRASGSSPEPQGKPDESALLRKQRDDFQAESQMHQAAFAASQRGLHSSESERLELRAELERVRLHVPTAMCGTCEVSHPWHGMYRCFQCQRWFDETCMAKHLATTHNFGGSRESESLRSELERVRGERTALLNDSLPTDVEPLGAIWEAVSREAWVIHSAAGWTTEEETAINDFILTARHSIRDVLEAAEDDELRKAGFDPEKIRRAEAQAAAGDLMPFAEFARQLRARIIASESQASGSSLTEASDSGTTKSAPSEPAPGTKCSSIASRWCPIHGRCSCKRGEGFESFARIACPLHGDESKHGRDEYAS